MLKLRHSLALLALGASLASCAQAQPRPVAAPVPASPTNPLPARSMMGMNLNGPADWNSELPFNDIFHFARAWISQKEGAGWGQGPALSLDADGNVKALEPGCTAETPMLTDMGAHVPQGDYVALWEGDGQIEIQGTSKIVSSEPHRIVFEPGAYGLFLRLKVVDPKNPIHNIRVLLPGSEKTYKGQPFNPVFLARWRGFNTMRFMDWMMTNGSLVAHWDDRPKLTDAVWTTKGVPLEMMIALCNAQDQNGWFNIPAHADDDYVRHFAQQLRDGLKPGLKAYIEYSNEVWNSQFEQNHYAGTQGLALKIGDKPWDAGWHYTGRRSKQIFAIFDEVYGGRDAAAKRIVRVIGSQSAVPYVSEQILGFEDVGKSADALAIAPYLTMISVPKANDPNTKLAAEDVQSWTPDQAFAYLENTALPEQAGWVKGQKAVADKYGLKLVAYEGGQHAVGAMGAENNDKITALFTGINRDARMGALYTRYFDSWKANGGDLFCNFASVGKWSKWGSWGLMETNDDDTPKYHATLDWNTANPRGK